jgi:asparagine synthase (glutamine-hydrolysing)
MCGIAGIAASQWRNSYEQCVRDMTDAMARRGPDSNGILTTGRACLGHRRLSIFDLSAAGHQPMTAADGRLSLVFNGAIYNFRELRKELQAAGYQFASQTDTEVLLHGYDRWGIDGLVMRCRGMFAFALWDAGRETLFLVRDRLGIKPLVYAEKNGSLAFASTIKALRRSGLLGDVNPEGVAEFLEHGYIADHAAIFVGARKLPPATIAEWRPGSPIALRRYWHSPIADNASTVTFEQAVERTERALHEAVALRLFADVPVSALLSGGIDSALVCWAAARSGAEVTAFTVATPGHRDDESADAQATAREIGIQVTVLPMSADDKLDSLLQSMEAAYSEPFATQSALGMLRVSEAIRSAGFKVVLTGDGGDDVFLGYQRHRDILKAQRIAGLLPPGSSALWRALRNIVPARGITRRGRNFLDYATAGLPAYLAAHDGLQNFRASGLLGERLANINPASRHLARDNASAKDLLQRYLTHDLANQFVGEYLTKVDGGTMYHGLEARSPFFDQSVWELAASLPASIRLHNGELKSVLRTIARRRISPRVAAGRKRGFSIPVEHWIATRWQAEVAERLADSQIVRQGWVNRNGLKQLLQAPRETGIGAHQTWYLLVLEEWLRANAG